MEMDILPRRGFVSPSPVVPALPSAPAPSAILTTGEGDAGQGLCAEHGSRHHHPTEQAKGSGHGGGQQGCAPRGSHHHPCGEGKGEGHTLLGCVSLHPAEMRRGSSTRLRGGGWGALSASSHTCPPPVWARTSYCYTGSQRCPLALWGSCTISGTVSDFSSCSGAPARGTLAQRCPDAPAFAPRASESVPIRDSSDWFCQLSEHPQNGGERIWEPSSSSSFCSSYQKHWGKSHVSRTSWSPGPLC